MTRQARRRNKYCFARFFARAALLALPFVVCTGVAFADTYAPGQTVTIGDFVYDDSLVATTSACTVSIWAPYGAQIVTEAAMTADANGWHHYDFSSSTQGTWPAQMTCGSTGTGDLVKEDRTFVIATSSAPATSDIAAAVATAVNGNTNSIVASASTSLAATLPGSIWGYSTRTLTSFGSLVSDIWSYSGRSLTSGVAIASDIWSAATRTLTGAGLSSGSLALQSDVLTASSSLGSAVTNETSNVNTHTDSALTSATSSVAAVINTHTDSATSGITSGVNSHTDTALATATSSVVAVVNANTNATILTASTSLGSSLTSLANAVTSIPAAVWSYSGRTLTSGVAIASDIWSAATRTLTGAGLTSGSLALQSDVTTASSSIGSAITNETSNVNAHTDSATSGVTTSVNAHTDSALATATSSLAAVVNAHTDSATSALTSGVNSHTDTAVLAASSSLGANISNASTSLAAAITSIPANVWAYTNRTLSSFGTLATDVWSVTTRTLTGAGLTSGSLALQSDVVTASSSLGSAIANDTANVNTHTDSATSGITSGVNSHTDTALATATSSVVAVVNAHTDSATSGITTGVNSHTDTALGTASSSIAAVVNANTNAASTSLAAAITGIPASVWAYTNRTLSSFGTLAADVWSATTRTLTGAGLTSGSLATQSDVQTASTSLAAAVANVSTAGGWNVGISDSGSVLAGETYRAKVTTLKDSTLTDAASVPTVTVYDADRNVVASGVSMTRLSTGVYEYTYTTSGSAAEGNWETVASVSADTGKSIQVNDYWSVVTAPAQVIIESMGSTTAPDVSANVRITNEGSADYEYHYEWCVVSTPGNACGGGDDTYYASAAKLIHPGDNFDTTLTATVPLSGTYYFKLVVYYGSQTSGATRQFTVTGGTSGGGNDTTVNPVGGGGGGGGGPSSAPSAPAAATATYADFNGDGSVNAVDFSILLAFWNTLPPFRNPSVDINKDGKVDSVDFSILLYEWGTGS